VAWTNTQHADYQRQRYAERMAMATERLGGSCVRCGAVDHLEFDHIDRATKVADVSYLASKASLARFLAEVDKCQLLCSPCHHDKSREYGETGGGWNKNKTGEVPHGTSSGYLYWKCRCDPCRAARTAYRQNWAERTGKRP
jgi:5-methylcytosine-specific restriction endonuclease McrA